MNPIIKLNLSNSIVLMQLLTRKELKETSKNRPKEIIFMIQKLPLVKEKERSRVTMVVIP